MLILLDPEVFWPLFPVISVAKAVKAKIFVLVMEGGFFYCVGGLVMRGSIVWAGMFNTLIFRTHFVDSNGTVAYIQALRVPLHLYQRCNQIRSSGLSVSLRSLCQESLFVQV